MSELKKLVLDEEEFDSFPDKTAREKLAPLASTADYAYAVSDGSGNVAFAVNNDGSVEFAELGNMREAISVNGAAVEEAGGHIIEAQEHIADLQDGKLDYTENGDYAYAVCDEYGNVAFAITKDGEVQHANVGTGGGGGGETTTAFDFTKCGLPVLYLEGDLQALVDAYKETGERIDGEFGYTLKTPKGTTITTGNGTCKLQGSSSVRKGYPKYNLTVKFSDGAFEATAAMPADSDRVVNNENVWGEQKKYCMKANWIDPSGARNVVSAKLWGDIVRSRSVSSVVSAAPDQLVNSPNGGAIDGFPCIIAINGEYEGLYTFNIPKDGWMFGMGDSTYEYVVCGESNSMKACGFFEAATFQEDAAQADTDYAIEYITDEDDAEAVQYLKDSFNNAIDAVIKAPDAEGWETAIAESRATAVKDVFDIDSAIDYYIFVCCISGMDNLRKNTLYATYDGFKWFMSAYDLDTTFGSNPYGKGWYPVKTDRTHFFEATSESKGHRLFKLIYNYSKDKLKARYAELRSTILSDENVWYAFSNFVSLIPRSVYNIDAEKWTSVSVNQVMPSTTMANVENYMHYYRMHCALLDKEIENL